MYNNNFRFDATDVTAEDFDERALEMLKQFPTNEAVYLVEQLIVCEPILNSDIEHIFSADEALRRSEQASISDVCHEKLARSYSSAWSYFREHNY